MSWRGIAAPIIERTLRATRGADEKTRAAALRAAYPFGQRQYHPYKIWLDEIKIQTGKKSRYGASAKIVDAPGQGALF